MEIVSARFPLCRAISKSLSITEGSNVYEFVYKGITYRLSVPKHFIFDGASIPRIAWGILGLTPHGAMDGPALPHDFCYHYRGDFPPGCYWIADVHGNWRVCRVPMSKEMSDELLKVLCIHFNVCGSFKASLVWTGVKWFGSSAWNSEDEDRKDLLLAHENGECNA